MKFYNDLCTQKQENYKQIRFSILFHDDSIYVGTVSSLPPKKSPPNIMIIIFL